MGSVPLGLQFIPIGNDLIAEWIFCIPVERTVHTVVEFCEGKLNIPPKAEVDGEPGMNLPIILKENGVVILTPIVGIVVVNLAPGGQTEQQRRDATSVALTKAPLFILLGPVTGVEIQSSRCEAWTAVASSDLREFVAPVPCRI